MQVTIDIPDAVYSKLLSSAVEEKTSVSDLLLRQVASLAPLDSRPAGGKQRVEFPLIRGGEPGLLMREGINLNHVAWMDDDEINELLAGR